MLYDPLHGDARTLPIKHLPRTCFLMTKLGAKVPAEVNQARADISRILAANSMSLVDAESRTTGRDFLLKIWEYMIAVPIGIAIVYRGIPKNTVGNIFFELGLMTALGKETVVVRVGNAAMPSDLIRTEWINYNRRFEDKLTGFLGEMLERAKYLALAAEQVDRGDPLLAIDCYRRAYLLTGDPVYQAKARELFDAAGLDMRSKNCVEAIMAGFCQ